MTKRWISLTPSKNAKALEWRTSMLIKVLFWEG